MLNFLYALILNQPTEYSPKYIPAVFPPFLEKIRTALGGDRYALKVTQLIYATELSQYLTPELRKSTLTFSSGKYFGDETYNIVSTAASLKGQSLQPLLTEGSKFLEPSVLTNLKYIIQTHSSPVYTAAAIAVLWALCAEHYYV